MSSGICVLRPASLSQSTYDDHQYNDDTLHKKFKNSRGEIETNNNSCITNFIASSPQSQANNLVDFVKTIEFAYPVLEASTPIKKKRNVHPSKLILKNMSDEGINCRAYSRRRVGRKPRPNVIPDEVSSEDYLNPIVEALFSDTIEFENIPGEMLKTPESRSSNHHQQIVHPAPQKTRGRQKRRLQTNENPFEAIDSILYLNNNNSNSDTASLFEFSDPKLADIVQTELPFLLHQEFDEVHELYAITHVKQEPLSDYSSGNLHPILSNLSLETPQRMKKRSCRRFLDFGNTEPGFLPMPMVNILDDIPLPADPESFPIPPPKRFRCSSYTAPPLPSPALSPVLSSFDCWFQEPFSCPSAFEPELISPVLEHSLWYQDDVFSQQQTGSYCSGLTDSSAENWDHSSLERQELQMMLEMWNQSENTPDNWNHIQSE